METQKARMLRGDQYDASDPELVSARSRARELVARFNATVDRDDQRAILHELLGSLGDDSVDRAAVAM